MPFGEELYAGTPNRTESQKYSVIGSDNVRKRFTGYEKDQETGLDFAEARYYNNQHGRFTAVDPLLASGKSANPQTFNRYVYVMNSPLRLTDPTGMQVGTNSLKPCNTGEKCTGTYDSKTKTVSSFDPVANVSIQAEMEPIYDTQPTLDPVLSDAFNRYNADYFSYRNSIGRGALKGFGNFLPDAGNGLITVAEFKFNGPTTFFAPQFPRFPTIPYENTTEAITGNIVSFANGAMFTQLAGGALTAPSSATSSFRFGSFAPRTVFFGHGGYEVIGNGKNYAMGSGMFTVPEGTSLTVYSRLGEGIKLSLGNAIEKNTVPAGAYTKTYLPGTKMPNFTLAPVNPSWSVSNSSIKVAQPIRVSDLLKPNMGICHWAACSTIVR
jgi:RHS repeat-associated protein